MSDQFGRWRGVAVRRDSECQGVKELQIPKGHGITPTNYTPLLLLLCLRPGKSLSSQLPLLIHVRDWTRDTLLVSHQAVMTKAVGGMVRLIGVTFITQSWCPAEGEAPAELCPGLTSLPSPCHHGLCQS